jgi:hypothetical protein
MVDTKSTNPLTALEHVLTDVLGEPPKEKVLQGPLRQALAAIGVKDINDLLAIDPMEDLRDITYFEVVPPPPAEVAKLGSPPPKGGKPTDPALLERRECKLSVVECRKVLQLQIWFVEYSAQNQAVPPIRRWFALTSSLFERWRSTMHSLKMPTSSLGGGVISKSTTSPLTEFNKGIKRDITEFKPFREDKYWLNFRRQMQLTAMSQGVGRVIDLDFNPNKLIGDDKQLYNEQNLYLYKAMCSIVLTSTGRAAIRRHANDHDASAVFREMTEYYTETRVADTAVTTLKTTIHDLRFDRTWNSGAVAFLNKWNTLIMDLNEIQERPCDSDEMKEWLTASLQPNDEMSKSIDTYDTIERQVSPLLKDKDTQVGKGMDATRFNALMMHLQASAITYDDTHKITRKTSRTVKAGETRRQNGGKPKPTSTFIPNEVWRK